MNLAVDVGLKRMKESKGGRGRVKGRRKSGWEKERREKREDRD